LYSSALSDKVIRYYETIIYTKARLKGVKMAEYILIVDEQDRETGYMEKMEVHKKGVLHRAFSVMIFNNQGELLLQKRAKNKYHSPGLWTNSCCSHQREGETLNEAVSRRVKEELGISCECKEVFKFKYKAEFDNGLIEHEIDHVFIGNYNGNVFPNQDEVEDVCWVSLDKLNREINENPECFTYWFKILMMQEKMQLIGRQIAEDKNENRK